MQLASWWLMCRAVGTERWVPRLRLRKRAPRGKLRSAEHAHADVSVAPGNLLLPFSVGFLLKYQLHNS